MPRGNEGSPAQNDPKKNGGGVGPGNVCAKNDSSGDLRSSGKNAGVKGLLTHGTLLRNFKFPRDTG